MRGVGWENTIEEGESEVVGGDRGLRNQKPSIYPMTRGHSSLWIVMQASITHSRRQAQAWSGQSAPCIAMQHVYWTSRLKWRKL